MSGDTRYKNGSTILAKLFIERNPTSINDVSINLLGHNIPFTFLHVGIVNILNKWTLLRIYFSCQQYRTDKHSGYLPNNVESFFTKYGDAKVVALQLLLWNETIKY